MAQVKINAELVKSRISLKALFERDGHVLARSGSSYVCRSPFNREKTPSCHVHEDKGYFKCFSSGIGGDCFTYWMAVHRAGFPQALEELAILAGLVSGTEAALPPPAQSYQHELEPMAPRLEERALNNWLSAAASLAQRPVELERIANWRGYSVALVKWAAERGLLALMPYYGIPRESFLVERPEPDGTLVPVGWHVRLGSFTNGNEMAKASWRFNPKGIGSWPFVAGDIGTARGLIVVEGQWDALALIDLLGWHEQWPDNAAVVGLRGAGSWRKFLAHYPISRDAVLVGIADRDNAGAEWNRPGGFYETAWRRCRRLVSYWPSAGTGKDFNDLTKSGIIKREGLVYLLQRKLAKRVRKKRIKFQGTGSNQK
ncbi:MAG: hypothetical protein LBH01_01040 [Verrucomicrobiales bacterium]|jgi:hypothetical protein|nr:hypothetical protein [Verrucomicrobiales bacterium]